MSIAWEFSPINFYYMVNSIKSITIFAHDLLARFCPKMVDFYWSFENIFFLRELSLGQNLWLSQQRTNITRTLFVFFLFTLTSCANHLCCSFTENQRDARFLVRMLYSFLNATLASNYIFRQKAHFTFYFNITCFECFFFPKSWQMSNFLESSSATPSGEVPDIHTP